MNFHIACQPYNKRHALSGFKRYFHMERKQSHMIPYKAQVLSIFMQFLYKQAQICMLIQTWPKRYYFRGFWKPFRLTFFIYNIHKKVSKIQYYEYLLLKFWYILGIHVFHVFHVFSLWDHLKVMRCTLRTLFEFYL